MTDTTDMQGKTVLITGGTSGVGQVSARELARRGARIALIGRDRTRTDSELEALAPIAPGIAHKQPDGLRVLRHLQHMRKDEELVP